MLLADAFETIGAAKKDYTRTPYIWQGLFLGYPGPIEPISLISPPHSIKIA